MLVARPFATSSWNEHDLNDPFKTERTMSQGISKKFMMAAMVALGVPGFLACEEKGTTDVSRTSSSSRPSSDTARGIGGAGPNDLGTAERGGKKKDKEDAGTGGSGVKGSSSGLTGSGTGSSGSGMTGAGTGTKSDSSSRTSTGKSPSETGK